jgi:hypothetical protein
MKFTKLQLPGNPFPHLGKTIPFGPRFHWGPRSTEKNNL